MARSTKTTTKTSKATSAGRTSARRSTPKVSAKKTAPEKPLVSLVSDTTEGGDAPTSETIRRPDLIQAVADRASLKRSDVKDVLDLVLDELGKALDARDELVLPPLGKISVKGRREAQNGDMLTIKLKRKGPPKAESTETGLAEAGSDS